MVEWGDHRKNGRVSRKWGEGIRCRSELTESPWSVSSTDFPGVLVGVKVDYGESYSPLPIFVCTCWGVVEVEGVWVIGR